MKLDEAKKILKENDYNVIPEREITDIDDLEIIRGYDADEYGDETKFCFYSEVQKLVDYYEKRIENIWNYDQGLEE